MPDGATCLLCTVMRLQQRIARKKGLEVKPTKAQKKKLKRKSKAGVAAASVGSSVFRLALAPSGAGNARAMVLPDEAAGAGEDGKARG